jgi:hypothetical protein
MNDEPSLYERLLSETKMMSSISTEDQQILDSLTNAVAEALERKRRLGQYAVVWRDGQPVVIGEELPKSQPSKPAATKPASSSKA